MKFGITCDVDSKIFMDSGMTVQQGRKRLIFYVDNETNFIKQIKSHL